MVKLVKGDKGHRKQIRTARPLKHKKHKQQIGKQVRKLKRSSSGYSTAVTIPKKICVALGLANDDFMKVYRRKERIILEKVLI